PAQAGTVHRLAVVDGEAPAVLPVTSSHGLGIAHAIRIGQALANLPPLLVIYTITAHQLTDTTQVHPQVIRAARAVAQAIAAETERYRTSAERTHAE
ncbi:hypothetical protein I7331_24325, partial [Frankia sp. AgB1.8]